MQDLTNMHGGRLWTQGHKEETHDCLWAQGQDTKKVGHLKRFLSAEFLAFWDSVLSTRLFPLPQKTTSCWHCQPEIFELRKFYTLLSTRFSRDVGCFFVQNRAALISRVRVVSTRLSCGHCCGGGGLCVRFCCFDVLT